MILKQKGSTIRVALRYKYLFVLDTNTDFSGNKIMLLQGRGQPTYSLSFNPQIQLWYYQLGYASNARVIQVSKLVDEIDLGEIIGPIDNPHFSNSELEFDSDSNKPFLINKAIELNIDGVEELCEACIKNKKTRIVKLKRITPITKRLPEIYANLWRLYELTPISDKNYPILLLDEFTCKSWIILLKSKNKFFDTFILWILRVEACGDKPNCLQTDSEREFISVAFQSFYKKRGIKIGYAAPYILKENKIAEQYWRTLVQIKDSLFIINKLSNQF